MQIKIVGLLASLLLAVETVPAESVQFISQIERLGLVGALIFAVVALWRKNERTEADKASLIQKLVESTDAIKELRAVVTSALGRSQK